MNKQGNIFQLVALLVILFVVAIVGLLFLNLSSRVTEAYQNMSMFNDSAIAQHANQVMGETAPRTTDYMVFFLFMGMVIGLLISASKTNFSSGIFFLFVLLLVITIFVASGMVNIYSGFANTPSLIDSSSQLVLTNYIFSKYTPLIITVLGGLIMLIMWGKQGSEVI